MVVEGVTETVEITGVAGGRTLVVKVAIEEIILIIEVLVYGLGEGRIVVDTVG